MCKKMLFTLVFMGIINNCYSQWYEIRGGDVLWVLVSKEFAPELKITNMKTARMVKFI